MFNLPLELARFYKAERLKESSTSNGSHARSYSQRGGDSGQNRNDRLNDELPSVLFHGLDSSFHLIVNCALGFAAFTKASAD